MTSIFDFAVAIPLTLAALALLYLGRGHIHGQMEQIAEKAKSREAERARRAAILNGINCCECESPVSHKSATSETSASSSNPQTLSV
ncbi:MAG: hypothetical protein ABJF10_28305 [Chthoniobacter sp.]|uniref:hypothetical protein n=1 Tax=Chthoniobacter sp. TaxID=2510640 RepID=UPI0032A69197